MTPFATCWPNQILLGFAQHLTRIWALGACLITIETQTFKSTKTIVENPTHITMKAYWYDNLEVSEYAPQFPSEFT